MRSCKWKRQSWWIGEVMSLAGSVDDIWSEFALSGEENTWGNGELIWRIKQKKIDISG